MNNFSLSTFLAGFFLFAGTPAFAYLEIGESNELAAPGTYKAGGLMQVRLSDGGGANFTGYFDGSLHDELGWRGFLGGGNTDFYMGGSVKWVPIPDYKTQPALGVKGELTFGRLKNDTLTVVRGVPMISKKGEWEGHRWAPYAGLPIGIAAAGGKSDFFANLAGGTEVRFESMPNVEFLAELGIGLTKSFSYLGIGVTYLFDTGFRNRPR